MKLIIKKATTSKIVQIFIQDTTKYDGSGLTGLVYNSSGLTSYYIKEGDASTTAITLVDATVGTYTSGGFKEVDATNMPGIYELHLPDDCFTSAEQVVIFLKGATNMAPVPIEIQLRDNTEKDVKDVVDNIITDTNELQTNQGEWVTADITALALEASLTAMKGATFAESTDSLEAIRDRGDDAWVTGSGASAPTAAEIRTEMDNNSIKLAKIKSITNFIRTNII